MKAAEIQKLSGEDLQAKLKEARAELFNLRFQKATGQLGNPLSIRDIKRDIARVKTVLRERELNAAGK